MATIPTIDLNIRVLPTTYIALWVRGAYVIFIKGNPIKDANLISKEFRFRGKFYLWIYWMWPK